MTESELIDNLAKVLSRNTALSWNDLIAGLNSLSVPEKDQILSLLAKDDFSEVGIEVARAARIKRTAIAASKVNSFITNGRISIADLLVVMG